MPERSLKWLSDRRPWIHIECPDGRPTNAKVYIRRQGKEPGTYEDEELTVVTKVTWEMEATGFPKAVLHVLDASIYGGANVHEIFAEYVEPRTI